LDRLDERIEQERKKLQICASEIRELKATLSGLDESLRKVKKPDDEWSPDPNTKGSMEFDINVTEYNEAFNNAINLHALVWEDRKLIEKSTYDRFSSVDEGSWIKALHDELEGLSKKEEAVNNMWNGIIAGMQKDFKALNQDLEMICSCVSSFNTSIGKSNVSNLTSLKIKINRRESLTAPIEKLINDEETPLLAGKGTVIDSLGTMLQKHPKISLDDLFDLSFTVASDGSPEKTYKQLDSIESNGTTITIKVLIHLLLINGLMSKDVRLPFYLDEAASLDAKNLKGIVRQATKLGFVPMFASPDGMDIAENLYFLQEENGKIVVNDDSKVTIAEYELVL